MDFLQRFFLESPWLLLPVLVFGQLILIRIWSSRRTVATRRARNVGFALCILLPLIQWWVDTPREQVQRRLLALVAAVEQGDVAAIGQSVSPQFDASGVDRATFIDAVERVLTRITVENAIVTRRRIDVDDGRAEAKFGVFCRLITREQLIHQQPSAWTVVFVLDNNEWQIVEVQPRSVPGFPFSNLSQLLGQ